MVRKKGNMDAVSRGKATLQAVWTLALPGTEDEAVEK
jgi:hypothetical protein